MYIYTNMGTLQFYNLNVIPLKLQLLYIVILTRKGKYICLLKHVKVNVWEFEVKQE